MRNVTRIFTIILTALLIAQGDAYAQSRMKPTDPLITYNGSNAVQPEWDSIGPWVRSVKVWWASDHYKAYIYKNIPFRLHFPKTYDPDANDGKKYPIMIFWHGLGEAGDKYDNEFQLYHGGYEFHNAVDDGTFDGYVIVMQSDIATGGWFGPSHFQSMQEILDYMIVHNKLDPFQILNDGLSAGGSASWDFQNTYKHYATASVIISSTPSGMGAPAVVNNLKYTPIWATHGGLDNNPAPFTAEQVRLAYANAGGNYRDLIYPDQGHGVWYLTWSETDFWPFMNRAYASNPWPLGGRSEFCPGETGNLTMGLAPGYDFYEWRRDGALYASGATLNSITIPYTQTGVYSARVRRNGIWSDWSRRPVNVILKPITISPDIQLNGLVSKVLPSPDGNTIVPLQVPTGYVTYEWVRQGSGTTLSTTNTLNVTTPGDYKVKVSEQFSCSSQFSNLFHVVDANGPNKPDPASNLVANAENSTTIRLDWSDNPTPQYNETNFEVYRSTSPGGPYRLIAITGADVSTYLATGLTPNQQYYFIVRAVNNTGAANISNEANVKTEYDNQLPTTSVLTITGISNSSVSLSWTPSTDNEGIDRYEVYVNGVKSYVTPNNQFLVSGLTSGANYLFYVKAIDLSGNASLNSNQVSARPSPGLNYKYYTYTGSWTALPNFSGLTPAATGNMQNLFLFPRTQNDRFAFLYEGYIRIPVSGTYTFRLNSDEGSRLWLGALNATGSPYSFAGTPVINNDGLHSATQKSSAVLTLTAGIYPIAIAYYDELGTEILGLTWKTPSSGGNFIPVPDIFTNAPASQVINKPTNLNAIAVSYRQVNLTWTDNSSNETGFEIFRSTEPFTQFIPVGRTNAGITAFQDTMASPNITYYYRVRAINNLGESDYDLYGQGVDYSYYEVNGLTALPNFDLLTPVKSGRVNNFMLGAQNRSDNFQFKFSTTINIPINGFYTFYLKSDEGSKLYIDGFTEANLVINHDGLHGFTEKAGFKNLSTGLHTIYVTYFEATGTEDLSVSIAGPGLSKKVIPDDMLGTPFANATTPAAAIAPTRPTNLTATGTSTSVITLNWLDNSTTETAFELYRSANNNSNYVLYRTLPANTNSFVDNNLFTNAGFYYKVKAIGAVNNSGFSNEVFGKTMNGLPVITDQANRTARFGVSTVIPFAATDADGDPLSFSAQNLPSFATFTDNGNKTATLTLNPGSAQQGVYNNITVIVTDSHGGTDQTVFNLTVNSNRDPVITAIADYTVGEIGYLGIPLTATDADAADLISWSGSNLPNAFTIFPGSNGTATLVVQPNGTASGNYRVRINATDNNGGASSVFFNLTVTDNAPTMPANLSPQYIFGTGVKLNWTDMANNETGYEIHRSIVGGSWTLIQTVTQYDLNTYTDNTVLPNKQYFYRIRAINPNDASPFSNVVGIFTNRVPQISAIANVAIKNNQTQTRNVIVVDDAVDNISFSFTNLPSFVTFTPTGNGTGTLNINPNPASVGVYNVTVTAKDLLGATTSTTFEISITDKDVTSVYLNFTDNSHTAGKPWNNLVDGHVAGTTFTNLLDDNSTNSGISVRMQTAWGWMNIHGMYANNGRDVFPDEVAKGALIDGANTGPKRIVVSGLSSTKKYNFVFFSTIDGERDVISTYTINGQAVTLSAKYNTGKTVSINGISPVSGVINIDVTNPANASHLLLSAMVIQSYPSTPTVTLAPANLKVTDVSRTTVSLQWQDRSDEASTGGFQIYRADNSAGSIYQLIASVGQNITSYTDINRVPNSTYYYIVRAKRDGTSTFSGFSNVAEANTASQIIKVNFNNLNAGPFPWNNTNAVPQQGYTWSNFMDDAGGTTSTGMVSTSLWSGLYSGGYNTGFNSGIYPDNILIESYGVFQGQTGTLKITGLNVSQKYNLTFFASATIFDDVTVAYILNGVTHRMDASLNKSGTLTVYGVDPDAKGEITFSVTPGSALSTLGLIGALTVQGYTPTVYNSPIVPAAAAPQTDLVEVQSADTPNEVNASVYPNPFEQQFTLTVRTEKEDKLDVMIYDISGQLVYQKAFARLNKGYNALTIQTNGSLSAGTYVVEMRFGNKKDKRLIKVVKR